VLQCPSPELELIVILLLCLLSPCKAIRPLHVHHHHHLLLLHWVHWRLLLLCVSIEIEDLLLLWHHHLLLLGRIHHHHGVLSGATKWIEELIVGIETAHHLISLTTRHEGVKHHLRLSGYLRRGSNHCHGSLWCLACLESWGLRWYALVLLTKSCLATIISIERLEGLHLTLLFKDIDPRTWRYQRCIEVEEWVLLSCWLLLISTVKGE
jgi:hypothetical protein